MHKRTRRKPLGFTELSDLRDLHVNAKCFILGAGPSVGFLNLKGIEEHVVISVNSSIMLLDWSKGLSDRRYWISNDVLCMRWSYFWKQVLKGQCNKLVRTSWRKNDEQLRPHGFRYFAPRDSQSIPLNENEDGLCSVSSVPTAIDLALLLGCQSIYLLGVDQAMIHGNSHFWQFWPKEKWPQRNDKGKNFRPEQKHQMGIFDLNTSVFEALRELANRKKVSIYNCSLRSQLKVFPKLPFEQSL